MSQASQFDTAGPQSSPPPNIPILEAIIVEDLNRPAAHDSSNFDAMCEVMGRYRVTADKCDSCDGRGYHDIDQEAIDRRERQISWYQDPVERRKKRAELKRGLECRKCGGSGETEVIGADTVCDACEGHGGKCKRCFGTGRVNLGVYDSMFTTARCGRCRGSGEVRNEDAQDECPLCRTESYNVPCTVRATGSSKSGRLPPGVVDQGDLGSVPVTASVAVLKPSASALAWADEDEIATGGGESRLLDAVREVNPQAAETLSTFHGPEGDRWAKHHWGREFSLWADTESGKRIVADTFDRSPLERGYDRSGSTRLAKPQDVIARERAAEVKSKVINLRLRALLSEAEDEARTRLASARAVLAEVAAR